MGGGYGRKEEGWKERKRMEEKTKRLGGKREQKGEREVKMGGRKEEWR